MGNTQKEHPPEWAQKFLTWFCRPELLEHIQGDLQETFEHELEHYNLRKARRQYALEVTGLFRPGIIRKFETLENHPIPAAMFKNYLKVAFRQILKYKLFSGLNIIGLAISMSVCLLLIMIMMDQFSYDLFHEKQHRIYRVISDLEEKNTPDKALFPSNATAPMPLAGALEESFEGIEDIVRFTLVSKRDTKSDTKIISLKGLWTEPSFFNIFSFGWTKGNMQTALQKTLFCCTYGRDGPETF